MHLNLEPIGIIKKVANKSEILIYSDFEQVIRNIVSKIGEGAEMGQKLLVIHKNNSKKQIDGHQVQVTKATLLERKGNLLTISKIEANEDSVIDVRLDLTPDTPRLRHMPTKYWILSHSPFFLDSLDYNYKD